MPVVKRYNKDFFKKWSHEMSYHLGFLYADGNIIRNTRGAHFISLYSAEKDVIERFKKSLASDHAISERLSSTGRSYKIQIGSKEMFEDLSVLGLFPGKSARMKMPDIPKEYLGDFIRGYFDGDGNVWSGLGNKHRRKPTRMLQVAFTSCSQHFLKALLYSVSCLGIKGGSIRKVKDGNYSRLIFSTHDALKLYEIMYNSPYMLCIQRKRDVFSRFKDMRL